MHSLEKLASSCKNISEKEIEDHRELSMLWYWRCLEFRNSNSDSLDYYEAIQSIFGSSHVQLLDSYDHFSKETHNFIYNKKSLKKLSDYDKLKLTTIAEKRFYAFEWIFSQDNWDDVDLVC